MDFPEVCILTIIQGAWCGGWWVGSVVVVVDGNEYLLCGFYVKVGDRVSVVRSEVGGSSHSVLSGPSRTRWTLDGPISANKCAPKEDFATVYYRGTCGDYPTKRGSTRPPVIMRRETPGHSHNALAGAKRRLVRTQK